MDANDEFLFDDCFDNVNLSEELRSFYQIINEEEQIEELNMEMKLTNLRNENHRRYRDINLVLLDNLPNDFETIVNEIKKIYSYISPNKILTSDFEESYEIRKIIDSIYNHLKKLNDIIKIEVNKLEKSNDERQLKIKEMNFSNFDKKILHDILNKYSDIVLYSCMPEENIIENYNRQINRKNDLNDLYRIINLEIDDKDNKDILKKMNEQINIEINNINNKILYLEDLMIEKSKYEKEFNIFKSYFTNVIAYDDNDYSDVNRVHHIICEDLKLKSLIYYFEENFIKEIEKIKQEETFIYEKIGIKNIKKSLDYISANYIDLLNEEEKKTINNLYSKLNNDIVILKEVYDKLRQIVSKIWNETVTDPYKYTDNKNFCFICSNNQFIDEKYQTILITDKMLDRVQDYSNYEIGFICEFNNNILYVTENEDIMTVDYNDMSNLKTPKQIEQEFINFKVCNRIALNGYLTKVNAVYIIGGRDPIKYNKAVELSNQYKLPLIVLKKQQ